MKLNPPQSVSSLASLLNCKFLGPANHRVTGVNEIHRVESGDLTFVDVEKYFKKAFLSAATTILLNKEVELPPGKAFLISDDPFRDYNRITEHFRPTLALDLAGEPQLGTHVRIGQHVVFGTDVVIGDGVEIGHNVVIGSLVKIGAHTRIHSGVTIGDCTEIGENCCIHTGARLGSEAFYFKKRDWGRDKMLTKGITVLEDFVEIGANTTIDAGVSAETRIGAHTKIDNLVQVGHDTIIGRHCVIAAQTGIAGVCNLGDGCIIWGQVGIASDVSIGNNAILLGQTGVISSLEGGKSYVGFPAEERVKRLRELAALSQLPRLINFVESHFPATKDLT